jgi:hypothetical protein
LEVGRNRPDRPVPFADALRLREKVGQLARVKPLLPLGPPAQELLALGAELALERRHELQRFAAQDLAGPSVDGPAYFDALDGDDAHRPTRTRDPC